jgi:hypothetical protein
VTKREARPLWQWLPPARRGGGLEASRRTLPGGLVDLLKSAAAGGTRHLPAYIGKWLRG